MAEFQDLFDSVGWPHYKPASSEAALAGSLLGAVALVDDVVIAMGRVVGDGGKFFYIQDLIVRPEHQGRGIAHQLVDRLMSAIKAMASGSAFIGVFATPAAIPLYEKTGLSSAVGGLTDMAGVKEPGDLD